MRSVLLALCVCATDLVQHSVTPHDVEICGCKIGPTNSNESFAEFAACALRAKSRGPSQTVTDHITHLIIAADLRGNTLRLSQQYVPGASIARIRIGVVGDTAITRVTLVFGDGEEFSPDYKEYTPRYDQRGLALDVLGPIPDRPGTWLQLNIAGARPRPLPLPIVIKTFTANACGCGYGTSVLVAAGLALGYDMTSSS